MKKLYLVIAILFTMFQAQAQTVNEENYKTLKLYNFAVEGESILWQKVYEVDMSADEIRDAIKNSMFFSKVINETAGSITGEFTDLKSLYEECGFKMMSIPFAASYIHLHGKVRVDIKDNKYRVTVADLMIEPYVEPSPLPGKTFVSTMLIRKKEYKKSHKICLKIYDYTLNKTFTLKKNTSSDDW